MSFEPVAAAVPCQVGCLLSVVIMPTCSLSRGRTLKKELLRAFTLLSMSELSLWRRHRSGDGVKVEYIKCQMSTQGLMALGRLSSENECLQIALALGHSQPIQRRYQYRTYSYYLIQRGRENGSFHENSINTSLGDTLYFNRSESKKKELVRFGSALVYSSREIKC